MIKFNRPETLRKSLTAAVMTIGLVAPVFGNAEANYSFGGDSGGGNRNCFEEVMRNCSTGGWAFGWMPTPNGGGFTITVPSVNGQRRSCKNTRQGSAVCTALNCDGRVVPIFSAKCNP